MKCPGQNLQFWKPDDVKELFCPTCGGRVEFWKDDVKRKCPRCGFDFRNPEKDLGCALWCKMARECLGLTPDAWEEVRKLKQDNEQNAERMMKKMKTMAKRKIIRIDEEKCTGCGECITSCAEGALKIVDGKARLISDKYCDGLGACLSGCPADALTVIEREADEFDEEAVEMHLSKKEEEPGEAAVPSGCPGAAAMRMQRNQEGETPGKESVRGESYLTCWPVKIELANPGNPIFRDCDLAVVSDCVPFAYRYFHEDYLQGKIPLCGCPKLNDRELYIERLAAIFRQSTPRSITITRMEVPCCSGMTYAVREAVKKSGIEIPVKENVVSVRGDVS